MTFSFFQGKLRCLSTARRRGYGPEFGWNSLGQISNLGLRGRGLERALWCLPQMNSLLNRDFWLLGSSDSFHAKVEVGCY